MTAFTRPTIFKRAQVWLLNLGRAQTFAILVSLLAGTIATRGEIPDFPMTYGEMTVAAGYYTPDGKYLGGLPKTDNLNREMYDCQDYFFSGNGTGNATACLQWAVDESAGDEFQVGVCRCRLVTADAYCSAWTCNHVHTDAYCDGGCYVDSNTDDVLCEYDVENVSGLFCSSWSCKEIDSAGRVGNEAYQCQRTSLSGRYCEAWNGNVTASEKIEVVACECKQEWQGGDVCSYWECEELGLKTCSSSKLCWCNLGVSVGVGGGLGIIGVALVCFCMCAIASPLRVVDEDYKGTVCACGICGLVWCCLWAVGVVIWGGVDGAKYVGIMWGAPISVALSFVVCCRVIRFEGDSETDQSS